MYEKLIECVPNFSEGRDSEILNKIAEEIRSVSGVTLLNIDSGIAANRTVFTFVGRPEAVIEAAFLSIKRAQELIDMRLHTGEHPRIGATDVMPLIPIKGVTMQECVKYAQILAKRVGEELGIPVYCYENASFSERKRNLAMCRTGEYEGVQMKMKNENWKPDFGPIEYSEKVAKSGITVIGARDFLLAVNFNLNSTSKSCANSIALEIREKGRIKRVNGVKVIDKKGDTVMIPGTLKGVKAIGWYIEEYGIAQVSTNITNIDSTTLHQAYEEVSRCARERGMLVTGTEVIGLLPKRVMVEAGEYFLTQNGCSLDITESEIIETAITSMGLSDLTEFKSRSKIIEYLIDDKT